MSDTWLAILILTIAALMVAMGWWTMRKEEKEDDQKTDGRWTHRE